MIRTSLVAACAAAALALTATTAPAALLVPQRSLASPAPDARGLAFGNGSLWLASAFDPSMTFVFEVGATDGAVRNSFMLDGPASAFAFDTGMLRATAELGAWTCGGPNPNRIASFDAASGAPMGAVPSAVSDLAGGIAVLGSQLFAAGAYDDDPCAAGGGAVEVMAMDPNTGALAGHFSVEALGASSRMLAANGGGLAYGSWRAGELGGLRYSVHRLSSAGELWSSDDLFESGATDVAAAEAAFRPVGMAWGDGEVYVLDAVSQRVLVYAYAAGAAPPPPPPPPPPPLPPPLGDPLVVAVDVKPGSSENTVNLGSNGLLTVAVLGASDFDVAEIDDASVRAGGAAPHRKPNGSLRCDRSDVDGDGQADFVMQVESNQVVIVDDHLEVTGVTRGGTEFRGRDHVRLVGENDGSGGKRSRARGRPAADAAAVARLELAGAYPNPTRDASTLRLRAPSAGPVQIEIRALDGRLVAARTVNVAAGDVAVALDELRRLPAGMYFVVARQESETVRTKLSVLR